MQIYTVSGYASLPELSVLIGQRSYYHHQLQFVRFPYNCWGIRIYYRLSNNNGIAFLIMMHSRSCSVPMWPSLLINCMRLVSINLCCALGLSMRLFLVIQQNAIYSHFVFSFILSENHLNLTFTHYTPGQMMYMFLENDFCPLGLPELDQTQRFLTGNLSNEKFACILS